MVLTVHTPATAGDEPDTKKQKMEEQRTLPPTADTNTQDTKGDLMPSLPSLPTDDASQPAAATAATSNASTATTLPLTEEEQTQRKSSEAGNNTLWKCAGCGLNENECNTPLLLFEDPEEADTAGKEGEGGKKCEEEKR